ncbi:Hint domain-containing protein [Celeribacter persicus]|jgi:hypothetical protein|uniref:Hint domain-containing protein n=1 Tax=Celeribacter persicus TaxID=1651082 RepID=A0A2T5HTL6_9RHOB|nr:Hint domain-containing protein [Celeribacter persicus]PTQ74929.1 Hint domain-containing protein [Celeribacter persicus]
MLVRGSLIQSTRDGEFRKVEELLPGDHVFDPWLDCEVKVIDILSRIVDFETWDRAKRASFLPIRISPGALGTQSPREEIFVSPQQQIFSLHERRNMKILCSASAFDLSEQTEGIHTCILRKVEYFALFTTQSHMLNVNGVLLQSFSDADLHPDAPGEDFPHNVHPLHKRDRDSPQETSISDDLPDKGRWFWRAHSFKSSVLRLETLLQAKVARKDKTANFASGTLLKSSILRGLKIATPLSFLLLFAGAHGSVFLITLLVILVLDPLLNMLNALVAVSCDDGLS